MLPAIRHYSPSTTGEEITYPFRYQMYYYLLARVLRWSKVNSPHNSLTKCATLERIRKVLELFPMILFPGVYAISRSICWTDVKYAWIASVIIQINYCRELVLRKSLGGEFVTATVKMPPGWPVCLCIAAGLIPVEVPLSGSGKFPQVCVLRACVW